MNEICYLTSGIIRRNVVNIIVLQVAAVESAATAKAERNATVTSMFICCGFIICWTCNQIFYFLLFVGYKYLYGTWFYHFTSLMQLRH